MECILLFTVIIFISAPSFYPFDRTHVYLYLGPEAEGEWSIIKGDVKEK